MRLTVGPLPPSVYWRRRVLVVGVLGLIAVGIVYAVSRGPSTPTGPNLSSTTLPTGGPTSTVTPTPTAFTLPVSTLTGAPVTTSGAPVLGPNCADSEILLTASPALTEIQRGASLELTL